jgi:outer membrane lipoprotein SlyB
MNANKVWCAACNTMVEVVVKTGISKIAAPAVGTFLGSMLGATTGRKRDAPGRAIVGGLIGGFVGLMGDAIAREAVPAAQKLVCGSCGCEHLTEHAG